MGRHSLQARDWRAKLPSCFERPSEHLMSSPISSRPGFRVFPDPPLSLPVRFCRSYPTTRWPPGLPQGRWSPLGQAYTAFGLSVRHVSPSALFSPSPTPGPEANVCLIRLSPFSTTVSCLYYLYLGSPSQIGKVRQPSQSIRPNTASLSKTRTDQDLLVLLPRRVHNVVVRSSLNPTRGGSPRFPTFRACIFANPLILGNRFTQCGRRRKRSVSSLSLHPGSTVRLTTFRTVSPLLVHFGTTTIS